MLLKLSISFQVFDGTLIICAVHEVPHLKQVVNRGKKNQQIKQNKHKSILCSA